MNQVSTVTGRAQRRLQWLGAQLPPVAVVDIPWSKSGAAACRIAEAVVAAIKQGIPRTLYGAVCPPELQVAVVDVKQGNAHDETR